MLRWIALAILLVTPLAGQQASFTRFGSGCLAPPMVLDPSIDNVGLPRIGRSYAIDYLGIQGTIGTTELVPVLLTGFSRQQLAIPQSLLPQQRPGCVMLLKPQFVLPMARDPNQPGRYVTRVVVTLPRDPSLVGATWLHQWFVLYLDCSNGPRCTIEAVGASDAAVLSAGL